MMGRRQATGCRHRLLNDSRLPHPHRCHHRNSEEGQCDRTMHRTDRSQETRQSAQGDLNDGADQDNHRPPHAVRNLREERNDQQRERREQDDAAVQGVEDHGPGAGRTGIECCRIERAAVLNKVQLREDRITDGSRLDSNQRRNGIGKHSIDRFHGLSRFTQFRSAPRIRHKNKDAGNRQEMSSNLCGFWSHPSDLPVCRHSQGIGQENR